MDGVTKRFNCCQNRILHVLWGDARTAERAWLSDFGLLDYLKVIKSIPRFLYDEQSILRKRRQPGFRLQKTLRLLS